MTRQQHVKGILFDLLTVWILIIVFFILILMFAKAHASQGVELVWEPPTTREDGSAFPLTDVQHYVVCGASVSKGACDRFDEKPTQPMMHLVDSGGSLVDTFFRVRVVDISNIASDWSTEIQYILNKPSAPGSPWFRFEWGAGS